MMSRRSIAIAAVLVLAGPALWPAPAAACCLDGTPWSGTRPMRLVFNTNLGTQLCGGGKPCSGQAELELAILRTANEWYSTSGSALRMVQDGETSVPPGTVIADKVHIFANNCAGGELGIAAWDGGRTWGKIRICIDNGTAAYNWYPAAWDAMAVGMNFSFPVVVADELGHIVGLAHYQDCPTVTRSINGTFYEADAGHLFSCDQRLLRSTFGNRSVVSEALVSSDGLSWKPGPAAPTGLNFASYRLTPSNTALPFAFTTTSGLPGSTTPVRLSCVGGSAWTALSTTPVPSNYPGQAASRDGTRILFFSLTENDTLRGMQEVIYRESDDGGHTWANIRGHVSSAATHTTTTGVTATYDPATTFLSAWRGSNYDASGVLSHVNEIYIAQAGLGKLRITDAAGTPYVTDSTPSIACAPPGVVGSLNCLLAWTNARDWYRSVQWVQLSVAGGVLALGPVNTHGYVTYGPVSVTYTGNAAVPWMITLSQGEVVYTWRKGPGSSDPFVDERGFWSLPWSVGPTVGSFTSGGAQMLLLNPHE